MEAIWGCEMIEFIVGYDIKEDAVYLVERTSKQRIAFPCLGASSDEWLCTLSSALKNVKNMDA